ncbi:MAG: hypothetical protein PHC37_03685 [Candidatus Omnitrophica bacterium]|nr:hypothetical protein [Candidatus Omnitrophota bacterium]MDD5690779.1 hypothetical protein [Candidatus Omnitrophota bacterium]
MTGILSCPISILTYLIAVAVGLTMLLRPGAVIEFQRRFYEKINWRIEPISMPKEIRNTKLMGLFLVLAAPLGIIYIISLS